MSSARTWEESPNNLNLWGLQAVSMESDAFFIVNHYVINQYWRSNYPHNYPLTAYWRERQNPMAPAVVSKRGFLALVLWVMKGGNGYRFIIRIETYLSNLVSCFGPRMRALAKEFYRSEKIPKPSPASSGQNMSKIWMTGLNPTINAFTRYHRVKLQVTSWVQNSFKNLFIAVQFWACFFWWPALAQCTGFLLLLCYCSWWIFFYR